MFPESCGENENRWAPEAGRRLPASSHDVAPEEEAIFGGYVLGIVAQGARPLSRPASERVRTSQARRTTFYKRGIRDCHCNGPCCRTRDVEGNSRVRRVDWAGTSRSWFQVPWPLDWLNGRSATWCAGSGRPDLAAGESMQREDKRRSADDACVPIIERWFGRSAWDDKRNKTSLTELVPSVWRPSLDLASIEDSRS